MSHQPAAGSDAKYEPAVPKLNGDAVPDVSLYSYIWFLYDEALESCWGACAVYGGVD